VIPIIARQEGWPTLVALQGSYRVKSGEWVMIQGVPAMVTSVGPDFYFNVRPLEKGDKIYLPWLDGAPVRINIVLQNNGKMLVTKVEDCTWLEFDPMDLVRWANGEALYAGEGI
jgi:hypothetical protein